MQTVRNFILAALLLSAPGKTFSYPSPVVAFLEVAGVIHLGLGAVLEPEQPWNGRPVVLSSWGKFNALKNNETAWLSGVEYWWQRKIWRLRPFSGIFATSKGGGAVYAGINHGIALGSRFAVLMNTAAAYYAPGAGKDLGSNALLRSGIEISFFATDNVRIALTFHHMSHGSIFSPKNPGVETATLAVTFPLGRPAP